MTAIYVLNLYKGAFKNDGSAYCAYGSSMAVVELDVLTGEHVIERMDVMFDAGEMINVGIELGLFLTSIERWLTAWLFRSN